MRTSRLIVLVGMAAALVFAGLALGSSTETYKVKAHLNGAQDRAKTKGTGVFTGTVVEKGKSKTLKWRLTFKKLTGKAAAAHIHLGKKGVAGPVAVALCGPCKSGAHGTAKVTEKIVSALEHHKAYVNVHTARYPNGEIRGQISVIAG